MLFFFWAPFVVVDDSEPDNLEAGYTQAASALWRLPGDDDDPDTADSPWEPGPGRFWLAAKFALIALRRKRDRVGDDALTGKEKQALDR